MANDDGYISTGRMIDIYQSIALLVLVIEAAFHQ
jgi:hypothetical protein